MSPFEDDDFHEWTEEDYEQEEREVIARAKAEPEFDYFEYYQYAPGRFETPKAEVGTYVAEQGFRVPIIQTQAEWESAFDEGIAMLRSEDRQDYDGFSGVCSSAVIRDEWSSEHSGFNSDFGKLVMRGLRSGELDSTYFMKHFRGFMSWAETLPMLAGDAHNFGAAFNIDLHQINASRWRYVEGTNVRVFADPNVEGRYHFGVVPFVGEKDEYNFRSHDPIGSYQVEPGEHDNPLTFRKHTQPFVATPFIEVYEQIRELPYFDTTQNPVLELVQDTEDNVHFVQYYKTGQKQDYIEAFDLPNPDDNTVITDNVRGITSPDGKDMRLFIAPKRLTKAMLGQGILCHLSSPHGFEVQLAARAAGFILNIAYISFQDNHFDSAPMYKPPLAAGMTGAFDLTPEPLLERVHQALDYSPRFRDYDHVDYVDIHVTSNGRQATIESDWVPKTAAYEDLRQPTDIA